MLTISGANVAICQQMVLAGRSWVPSAECRAVVYSMESLAAAEPAAVLPSVNVDALAYVIFTSGSTGTPKGVEISHRGATNTCLDIGERFGVTNQDVNFALSSLAFDLSVWDVFGILAFGATCVMCKGSGTKDPDYWWQQLFAHGVTTWNSVPAMFEMLLEMKPPGPLPLKLAMLSGDAIRMDFADHVVRSFPELRLVALGGATEASIWSNFHEVTPRSVELGTTLVPYGCGLSNQVLFVLDESMDNRPLGAVGEIFIGGVGLARGYFADAELTSRSFCRHPTFGRIYATGDLGRYLRNGEVEILGRKDCQLKVGGNRVESGHVEAKIELLESIKKAAVALNTSGQLVAFYTLHAGEPVVADELLRAHMSTHLPDYMWPSTWISVSAIPLSANGKVDRGALKHMARDSCATQRAPSKVQDAPHDHARTYARTCDPLCAPLGAERVACAASVRPQVKQHDSARCIPANGGMLLPAGDGAPADAAEAEPVAVLQAVLQAAAAVLGLPVSDIDPSVSLAEQGLTSLLAIRLAKSLSDTVKQKLPSTLAFAYPTIQSLSARLRDVMGSSLCARAVQAPVTLTSRSSASVACRHSRFLLPRCPPPSHVALPASSVFERVISEGAVEPVDHWRRTPYPAPTAAPVFSLEGAETFDNELFTITSAESRVIDPQQRVLLECSISALQIRGRDELLGNTCGVALGMWASEYAEVILSRHSKSAFASMGYGCSATAGRVSFIFGLHGPCVSYDTACSSALVACHAVTRAVQRDECGSGLLAAVNMVFSPTICLSFATSGFISSTRSVNVFDSRADGYVRGETCGVVALGSCAGVLAPTAAVSGCRIWQDGRSASLTAPNGLAQKAVVQLSHADAGIRPRDLGTIEAHGTGTSLGDPIEVQALVMAGLASQALSGVKAIFGHCEPAAGIAGLLRLQVVLKRHWAMPNVQLRLLNPYVAEGLDAPVAIVLPTHLGPLPLLNASDGGGVSSFGSGGTIAHVVLQRRSRCAPHLPDPDPSASNKTQATTFDAYQGDDAPATGTGTTQCINEAFDPIAFKLSQPAVFGFPAHFTRIALPRIVMDDDSLHRLFQRKSYRHFERTHPLSPMAILHVIARARLQRQISLTLGEDDGMPKSCEGDGPSHVSVSCAKVGYLLAALAQYRSPQLALPKYEFGAAGSLYSVQAYVCVCSAQQSMEDDALPSGLFYYDPVCHELVLISELDRACAGIGSEPLLILRGLDRALRPVYGDLAEHLNVLNMGYALGAIESGFERSGLAILRRRRVPPILERFLGLERNDVTAAFSLRQRSRDSSVDNLSTGVQLVVEVLCDSLTDLGPVGSMHVVDNLAASLSALSVSAASACTHASATSPSKNANAHLRDRASFSIYLIPHGAASERDFLLEAGALSHHISIQCPGEGLGVCPDGQKYPGVFDAPVAHVLHGGRVAKAAMLERRLAPLHSLFTGGRQPARPSCTYRRRVFPWREFTASFETAPSVMFTACWAPTPPALARLSCNCLLLVPTQRTRCMGDTPATPAFRQDVAALLTTHPSATASLRGMRLALSLAQHLVRHTNPARVFLLTSSAFASSGATSAPAHGGAWGLARVLRLEHAALHAQSADVSWLGTSAVAHPALGAPMMEVEVSWRATTCRSARLRACSEISPTRTALASGLYTITGGLGGLGPRAAKMLVESGATGVVLSSRSGRMARPSVDAERSVPMHVAACDIGDAADALAPLASVAAAGMLHAAGVVHDKMLRSMAIDDVRAVFAPKALAASHVQAVVVQVPLEAFGLFSSVTSTFGNVGQANYAAANSYLDVLAFHCRMVSGVAGSSLQIPAVRGFVMMATQPNEDHLKAMGAISLDVFAACLGASLAIARAGHERVQAPLTAPITPVDEVQELPGERRPVALWRRLTLQERESAWSAAYVHLQATGAIRQPPSGPKDVVVVGAGVAGISVASQFVALGVSIDVAVLEKRTIAGGVWTAFGNAFSRVNSTEPGYRLRLRQRSSINTNHSYCHEILTDCARAFEQFSLGLLTYLGVTVVGITQARTTPWRVGCYCNDHRWAELTCTWLVLCTNRRLGEPRALSIPGQESFGGQIRGGMSNDSCTTLWKSARVLILGHGPYATENARTGIEHGCARATFVVRRHGIVCPELVDYVNYVRDYDETFGHPAAGSATIVAAWRDAYRVAMATRTPPRTANPGCLVRRPLICARLIRHVRSSGGLV